MSNLKTLIIAEAGVNHNGDINLAHKLIDAAADSGADIVKFQTYNAKSIATVQADQANYQTTNLGVHSDQLSMLRNLQISLSDYPQLIRHCNQRNIEFLSTPFDLQSVELLEKLGVSRWKIASGEITNLPLLRKIGSLPKQIILSTGMSTLSDIELAITSLVHAGATLGDINILHCTTEYPAPPHEINLRAIDTIKKAFGLNTGYSDHTMGIHIPVAAVALGATIIEKHLTLDCNLPGPDHSASIEPKSFSEMVACIRDIELSIGNGIKKPSQSEIPNLVPVRKSIVASKPIARGELFSSSNLTAKRPGSGISPMCLDLYIGKPSPKDYKADELIE